MARLTLCMIVRDEERLLADCLRSAGRAVDRMVVVDTGSTDATREIAREFGAEVVDFEWCDDFAAARNAGLALVDTGYVLVLDADERLTGRGAKALRAAVKRGRVDLGLLPLHHASSLEASVDEVVSGRARHGEVQMLPRLLRRTPDLCYEGIIHESVGGWLQKGRRVENIDAPIVHYGAAPELREALAKNERNLRLLERRAELEPGNSTNHAYLAAEQLRLGNAEEALETARRAWQLWRSAHERGERNDVVLPATLLGQLALQAGATDEAIQTATTALDVEEHPNLHLIAGIAAEQTAGQLGDAALSQAALRYERCLALAGRPFMSEPMAGATSWQASMRLGSVRLQQECFDEAKTCFETTLRERPDELEAKLGLAEALLGKGDARAAFSMLEPLMSQSSPDAWLLAARSAVALGAPSDALALLEQARVHADRGRFVGAHRRVALEQLVERLSESSAAPGVCVFAWPCYDQTKDIDTLMSEYGDALAARPDLVLCLRHDPSVDGDIAIAESRLQRAFADHLGEGRELQIVLVGNEHRPSDLAAERDIAIDLPGTTGVRKQFLDELGARRVDAPAALRRALASV